MTFEKRIKYKEKSFDIELEPTHALSKIIVRIYKEENGDFGYMVLTYPYVPSESFQYYIRKAMSDYDSFVKKSKELNEWDGIIQWKQYYLL